MKKKRVMAFIDGFNLYHSVHDTGINKLKWLNLWNLAEAFTLPSDDELIAVKYFTAYATWKPESHIKHKKLVKANKYFGVEPIFGQFRPRDKYCKLCKRYYKTHEEKKSDVNLSLEILSQAFEDNYDKAIIITGDSDIIPAIEMTRRFFKNKLIFSVIPYGKKGLKNFKRVCHHASKIEVTHYKNNLLPDEIKIDEHTTLTKPEDWS